MPPIRGRRVYLRSNVETKNLEREIRVQRRTLRNVLFGY